MPKKPVMDVVQITLRIPRDLDRDVDRLKPADMSKSGWIAKLIEIGVFTHEEDLLEEANPDNG